MGEYIPILLVGCLFKILSKMCAARLKGTLDRNMSDCQTSFMLGRQFLDGVMILNEIIDLAKKEIQNCMIIKVDCEQACDCVS